MAEQDVDSQLAGKAEINASEIADEVLEQFEKGELEGMDDMATEESEESKESVTEDETPQESKEESETTEEETVTEEKVEEETQVEEQEETEGEKQFVTPEEIRNLQGEDLWSQMSQWRKEGRLSPEQSKELSAMESVYHRSIKKKDDEYKTKLEQQVNDLQQRLVDREKKEDEFKNQQRREREEADLQRRLEELDPEERAQYEDRLRSQQEIAQLKDQIGQLTSMVTTQQTESYSQKVKREIGDAISKISGLDPDLAKMIEEDSLPQLYLAWDEDKNMGKQPINFTSPKEVVDKIHNKYMKLLAPEKIRKIVETSDEYKDLVKDMKKKGKEELIQKKAKGGKTVPQSPKGGDPPQPKTKEKNVKDVYDYHDNLMKEIEEEFGDLDGKI